MFLCGAGGALLAIPTLDSLLPAPLAAQPPASPRRLFALFSRNGFPNTDWYPTSAPPGYRLRDAVYPGTDKADGTTHLHLRLPEDPAHAFAPLSDFGSAGLSTILGPSLVPFHDKLTLLRGVDFANYCGHNHGAYYGNYAACTADATGSLPDIPTIDQVLAYSDRFYPELPVRRSLHVGTGMPHSFSYSDYGIEGGAIEQQSCFLDPRRVWDTMFAGLAPAPDEPAEHPNRRLLDVVREDYARVLRHRRLGANDRLTLDRHMSLLADIQSELASLDAVMCEPPDAPPSFNHRAPYAAMHDGVEAFRQSCGLLIDLCVAAVRCDLTRVVTFNIGEALHDGSGSWEGSFHSSADVPSDWHHYAHDAFASESSMRNLVGINRFIANELFVPLLERLDVEEADGRTFLDNSLVCWGAELGPQHWNVTVPTLLAGSAGGALRTGRYIDYSQWEQSYAVRQEYGVLVPGIPHNRLLVTILQAMGLSPEDYERDGLPGYGLREGTMGLRSFPTERWDLSRVGDPLPGLMV
jgi:hypothetical protein